MKTQVKRLLSFRIARLGLVGACVGLLMLVLLACNLLTTPTAMPPPPTVTPAGGQPAAPGGGHTPGPQLPSPPPPDGQSSSAITIGNIALYPGDTVYYGSCTTEPTLLNVQATIDPLNEIASADLYYTYVSGSGMHNSSTAMVQLGIGDYAGDIDAGAEAGGALGSEDGSIDFFIRVTDKRGTTTDTPLMSVALKYCPGGAADPGGGQGDSGGGPSPGGGQGAVDFVNNTTYPIIFLEIDGVQQFPSSPLGILSGSSYRVNVGAGSHTFAAYNGWWEGDGSRFLMYNWNGSFDDQEGNVTFTDPSIHQLLTGFGSSGYYLTDYWTGDPVEYHEAGFCFYSDGSFVFYLDGARADQGVYGDVSRSAGLVTFSVSNSDGSERFDGLYLETEGKFSMENGPADWRVLEYVHQGAACP